MYADASVSSPLAWYAVWTRSRHEKVVLQQLLQNNLETFLPTIARWSHWRDRRKKIGWPLFPGYCFVRFDGRQTLPILKCAGVLSIISFEGRPAPIADGELDGLRRLLETKLTYDSYPWLQEGTEVEIVRGPLTGVVGRLVRKDERHATVVLSVTLINQAVRVEVDAADVTRR